MSKARDIADLGAVTSRLDTVGASDGALSNRNLIINGAMQVAQRGTSFGSLGSRAYTLDRWDVDAGVTVQRADLSVDEISSDTKLKYALQLLGNTSSQYFRQPIEDVTLFSSVTCTLSFWVKGSAATTLDNIYARQAFGSGGSSVVDTAFSSVSHSVTTNYTKYTGTVTLPSISGKTLGSGHHLELFMQVPNGVTIYITGAQLEVGDTATPFEHRSYGDELARCQRYFQKSAPQSDSLRSNFGMYISRDGTYSAVQRYNPVRFVQTMRVSPTVSIYDAALNDGYLTQDATNGKTAGVSLLGDQSMMVYGPSGLNHLQTRFGFYLDAEL
jgi:hypothetical protein